MTLYLETQTVDGPEREPVLAAVIVLAAVLLLSTAVASWSMGHAAGAAQADATHAVLEYCVQVTDAALPIVREHDAEILAKLRLLGPEKVLAPLVDGG